MAPPQPSFLRRYAALAFASAIGAVTAYLIYVLLSAEGPRRGYTAAGYLTGSASLLAIAAVFLYSWRKRRGQETTPGHLSVWLAAHVWLSALALWFALVHSGFHFDGSWGTAALLLLLVSVLAGVGGLYLYMTVPSTVPETTGNLSVRGTERALKDTTARIEESTAGRSAAFSRAVVDGLAGHFTADAELPRHEVQAWEDTRRLLVTREELQKRMAAQQSRHRTLRGWLYLHVPASCLFAVVLVWHMVDATELLRTVLPPDPTDFASPETCAECHRQQYEEWIGSMHAIAMSSPVTELQNRLVVLKERDDTAKGIATPAVGDACVACHAPTGYAGQGRTAEDVLAFAHERAPASAYGVSCVACHIITDFTGDEHGNRNLEFSTRLKTMYGQFGHLGGPPPVGNPAHRSEGRQIFMQTKNAEDQGKLCGACHTVSIGLPDGKTLRLQETYDEWLEPKTGAQLNWSREGLGCMDCHSQDLDDVAAVVAQLRNQPLESRLEPVKAALLGLQLPEADRYAADPTARVDGPLPLRRERRHTFTGVDYHLEPELPFVAGTSVLGDADAVQAATRRRVDNLHKIAAAVDITGVDARGNLNVRVMNLGTGHDLPSGFAFAREMWLEVAVSDSRAPSPDDFRVIIGGTRGGRPIGPTDLLDKHQAGLKNFQAVLFDEPGKREVVLQNEATTVLKGKAANDRGFPDRQEALLAGEIRELSIPLPEAERGASSIRVRLRFRNLPPSMLEGFARKFDARGERANAERSRRLIGGLQIFEMASDVLERDR